MKSIRYLFLLMAGMIIISSCRQPETATEATETPDSVYIQRGDKLVAMTFDTLRNSLTGAIGEHGFVYAISFCNEQAYPLTTLYQEEGITIRRASDRYRNPQNEADSLENVLLAQFRAEGPSTRIVRTANEVHYIKPILMQGMCLNCHGTADTQIKQETLAAIHQKYPQDKATGYSDGELRGLWHIVFSR